jgi:hypothetical protein
LQFSLQEASPETFVYNLVCRAGCAAEFVNVYTKVFMFLGNILLENDSLFEEHNNFIYTCKIQHRHH